MEAECVPFRLSLSFACRHGLPEHGRHWYTTSAIFTLVTLSPRPDSHHSQSHGVEWAIYQSGSFRGLDAADVTRQLLNLPRVSEKVEVQNSMRSDAEGPVTSYIV